MTYLMATDQVSERRACRAAQCWRSSLRYTSVRDPLTALRLRMRELAETRVRFGYRRLLVLLRREGWEVGNERGYRVYIEAGLAAAPQAPVAARDGGPPRAAAPGRGPPRYLSMDFVADELADGRRVRTLTILDLCTRECLEIAVGRGLTGQEVVRTLEQLRFDRGLPQRIYCDHGRECVSAAMDLWASTNKVILDFSRRGKPTDNATIESLNGRFRSECLNVHWVLSGGCQRENRGVATRL